MNRLRARGGTAEERLEQLLRLQDLLGEVNRRIGPALDLDAVLAAIVDAMRSLVDFRGGSVCLAEDGLIRIVAAHPAVSPEVLAARLPVGKGLVGTCVASGQPVYSPDLDTDPRVDPALRALGSNAPTHSYLAVPLVCLGQTIGCLQVDSTEVDAFDSDDLRLLEGLATQVAGAIESARRYEQMFELERLKSDFVARVSHELRTPLTISSGFLSTLTQQFDQLSDDQRKQFLEKVERANERLWSLVDELLAVTILEAGAAEVADEPVALPELCEEVRSLAPEAGGLRVECPPDAVVRTDHRVVRQIMRLLVDNALRYAGDAELTVTVSPGEPGWSFTVRDHGPGLPAQVRARLFERFVRGPHEQSGLGLGLFLARSLASSLGAVIELDENVAPGTCFRVRFASGSPA